MSAQINRAIAKIAVDGLSVGIIALDKDCRVLRWNRWMEKHSGIREKDILGQNIVEIYPEIRERGKDNYLLESLEKKRPALLSPLAHHYLIPLDIVRQESTIRMFQSVRIYPFSEDNEKDGGVIIVINDLTEQILYEKEIRSLNSVLTGVRNVNRLITRVQTEEELLKDVCKIMVEDIGYLLVWIGLSKEENSAIEPVAWAVEHGVGNPDELESELKIIGAALEIGNIPEVGCIKADSSRCELARKIGCKFFCSLPIQIADHFVGALNIHSSDRDIFQGEEFELLNDLASDISFAIKTLRDRAVKRQAEADLRASQENMRLMIRELTQAHKTAQIGERAKNEFIANMSHEVRTPLNIIIGMSNMMIDEGLNKKQEEYLSTLEKSAYSLLGLFNDVLDLAMAEAGRLELKYTDFDFEDLLNAVMKELAPDAYEKELELICNIRSDLPLWLRGDPDRLRQILINIAGNAVKFRFYFR